MDRSPRLLSGAARGGDTICAGYITERLATFCVRGLVVKELRFVCGAVHQLAHRLPPVSYFTCSTDASCGPVKPFLADGMSADAEDGYVEVELESSTSQRRCREEEGHPQARTGGPVPRPEHPSGGQSLVAPHCRHPSPGWCHWHPS